MKGLVLARQCTCVERVDEGCKRVFFDMKAYMEG